MSEGLLASSYCSGSALAPLYGKNLKDWGAVTLRDLEFRWFGILAAPDFCHTLLLGSAALAGKERRGSHLRLLFPMFPQTNDGFCRKRESCPSHHFQPHAPIIPSFPSSVHPGVLDQKTNLAENEKFHLPDLARHSTR